MLEWLNSFVHTDPIICMVGFFIVGWAGAMVFADCFLISSCFVDQDWLQLNLIQLCLVAMPDCSVTFDRRQQA